MDDFASVSVREARAHLEKAADELLALKAVQTLAEATPVRHALSRLGPDRRL
ncbi:hypothetical protein ACWCRD_31290 [Streptomyces sp. NPDC002092]